MITDFCFITGSEDNNDDETQKDICFAIMTANENEWQSAMHILGVSDCEVTESFVAAVDKLKGSKSDETLKAVKLMQKRVNPYAGYKVLSVGNKKGIIFKCAKLIQVATLELGLSLRRVSFYTVQMRKIGHCMKAIFIVGCCGAAAKGNPVHEWSDCGQQFQTLGACIDTVRQETTTICEVFEDMKQKKGDEFHQKAKAIQEAIRDAHWGINSIKMAVDVVQKGVGKVDIGTIFVGEALYEYAGKIEKMKEMKIQLRSYSVQKYWISLLSDNSGDNEQKIAPVRVVPFYSGDFVIKDQDFAADLHEHLQHHKMVGYEMEGIGAMAAVDLYKNFTKTGLDPHIVLVKGVSDNAGSDKNEKAPMRFFSQFESFPEVDEDTRQQMCTMLSLTLVIRVIAADQKNLVL